MPATLEDSIFEDTPSGRLSAEIDNWSVEQIKRAGGDAVKVLAWYRPDAGPDVLEHQHNFVRRIGEACRRFVEEKESGVAFITPKMVTRSGGKIADFIGAS